MATTLTGGLTLSQYALMSNSPLQRAVIKSIIMYGSIMQDIPWVNRQQLVAAGSRMRTLPTPDWVKLNQAGDPVSAQPDPFMEQVFIIHNTIFVDRYLVQDINQFVNPRSYQTDAYLMAVSYDFNDKFINNSHVTGDQDSIVGLRPRLDDPTTYKVRAANKINGGGVDITQAGTAATFGNFTELLSRGLRAVGSPDGTGVVVYMNGDALDRISNLAGRFSGQGGYGTTVDQFGRKLSGFRNAVFRDAGTKADQSTNIITTTETAAGIDGASNYTSLYFVNYLNFGGWQYGPIEAEDLGLMKNEGNRRYGTAVNWAGGLYPATDYCFARIYSVKYS